MVAKLKNILRKTRLKNLLLILLVPTFIICILLNLFAINILISRNIKEKSILSISEIVSQTKLHLDYRFYNIFEQFVLLEHSQNINALNIYDDNRQQYYVNLFKEIKQIRFSYQSMIDSIIVVFQRNHDPPEVFYDANYFPPNLEFSFSSIFNGKPLGDQADRAYQWYNLHEDIIFPGNFPYSMVTSLYKVVENRESNSKYFILFNFKNDFYKENFGKINITNNGVISIIGNNTLMNFKDYHYPFMIDNSIVKKIEEDLADKGMITFYHNGKEKYYAIWESFQLGNWKLAAVFPEVDLYHSAKQITTITIFCSSIAIIIELMLLFFIVSLISKSIKDWIVKTNRLCSEINDILLDNVICFEITQLNTGIINLVTRVQKLTEEKIFEENKNREIEINFLHEQIKPHFLYNTLSTIEQLGGLGNYETMIEVIKSLSGFYKLGLSKGKEIVNLNNEINHASCYLNIQKVINNNISYMIDVPEYCTKLMLIKFTLQPLVENAVLHAVKHGEMLTITISASIANNDLVIFILDNGIGIKKDELFKLKTALAANNWSELSNVYGMRNVNERIRLHYGQRYGLDIESTYDVGTKISITIPVQEGK